MWMIYGAAGYTGALIAREAVKRGERPILAGRSAEKLEPLARELGLETRVFDVGAPDLSGVELVLHCAGPFLHTSKSMVDACLAAGVHYVDITGEIAVFEPVLKRNDEAVQRGVTLLPGAGFYVVREIPFSVGKRMSMTIPWGDVSTAYHTTGIPNIRVYKSMPPKLIAKLRRFAWLLPIAQFKPIKKFLLRRADRIQGPGEKLREEGRTHLWGRVTNAKGDEVTLTMTVREGYQFTVLSTLAAVHRILSSPRKPGAFTPAKLFGADFVKGIEGTELTS